MLYILTGDDDYSIHQALEEIKGSIGDPALLAANTTTLDGQKVAAAELKAIGDTVPFLAEKRLVIVSGLLGRFEGKKVSKRPPKTTRKKKQTDSVEEMAAAIGQMPDSTTLVLVDSGVKSSNPLLRALSANAEVRSFPPLRNDRLHRWIQEQARTAGGSISSRAIDLLASLVGNNLWVMAGEIDKLVAYTAGRRIETEDVQATVSYTQQANVFAMVDAILASRAGAAEQWLERLLEQGAAPAYLLVMLGRQLQLIVRTREMKAQQQPDAEIQRRLGMASDFVLRKTLAQARRYPLARLKDIYAKLLEADLAIKTGRYDAQLALNILIADLCASQPASLDRLPK